MSDKGLTMDEAQKRGMARRSAERAQLVQPTLPTFAERRAAQRVMLETGRKPAVKPAPKYLKQRDLVNRPFAIHTITLQTDKFNEDKTCGWVVVETEDRPGVREGVWMRGTNVVPVLEAMSSEDLMIVWTFREMTELGKFGGYYALELIPAPLDLDAADPMGYPHVDGASA